VALVKTNDLISLIEAHSDFPFTLIELKDLFSGKGDATPQVEDLINQNSAKKTMLEQFKMVVDEMHFIQDGKLGYFTLQSLAAREKIEDTDIELDEIPSIINLLQLPFIKGIDEIEDNQYLMTVKADDLANIFHQISQVLSTEEVASLH
jgi:hypothetical protein